MDAIKTNREIGFFAACTNLVKVLKSEDVRNKVGAVMPLPGSGFLQSMENVADWLAGFGKSKYLFFTPEIALIEKLPSIREKTESIIMIPCDMDEEIKMRLKDNLPSNMIVSLLEEPYFPRGFVPANGIIVVSGYLAGDRIMVLPETYRMIEHYSGFMGKMVFAPYTVLKESTRYCDWIEVASDKFSEIWRDEL